MTTNLLRTVADRNKTKNIIHLDLGQTIMSNETLKYFSKTLKQNTKLENLTLISNTDLSSAISIIEALENHPNLSKCQFKFCNIFINCKEILKHINYSKLKSLKLNECMIGDEGVKYLFRGLKNCYYLKFLELNKNNIKDVGIDEIGNYLQGNNSLNLLSLNKNEINQDKLEFLFYSITKNQRLTFLHLDDVEFERNTIEKCNHHLRDIHCLEFLSLKICGNDLELFRRLLFYNHSIRMVYLQNEFGQQVEDQGVEFITSRNQNFIYISYQLHLELCDITFKFITENKN